MSDSDDVVLIQVIVVCTQHVPHDDSIGPLPMSNSLGPGNFCLDAIFLD